MNIFTLTAAMFWPYVLLLPAVATIGFSILFFEKSRREAEGWASNVLGSVALASVSAALICVPTNLIAVGVFGAIFAGIAGAFCALSMIVLLSMVRLVLGTRLPLDG